MKRTTIRNLLLGAAAGFVAMTGAQAADLPVKAKPVQYVKICDLYGTGYYYVPGTDTCIKIGGMIWASASSQSANGFAWTGFGGVNQFNNRLNSQDLGLRTRIRVSGDVRSQTSMGTLRGYFLLQFFNAYPGDNAASVNVLRGYVQFAGFTVGRSVSFFDLPELNGSGGTAIPYIASIYAVSTPPTGTNTWGYTAAFGNGVSLNVAMESSDQRRRSVVSLGPGSGSSFGFLTAANATNNAFANAAGVGAGGLTPDFVASLDFIQPWGAARISGAVHNVSAAYYTGPVAGGATGCVAATPIGCGHPSDAWGWAVGAGIGVTKVPGTAGDLFSITAGYSVGAAAYVSSPQTISILNGNRLTVGNYTDGVYTDGGQVQLTTVWGAGISYSHMWAPEWRSMLYAGYSNVSYNGTATALICPGGVAGTPAPTATGLLAVSNCNPNFDTYQLGVRPIAWNPVPNLDIGFDVLWVHVNSAFAGTAVAPAMGAQTPQAVTIGSADVFLYTVNLTRQFWP